MNRWTAPVAAFLLTAAPLWAADGQLSDHGAGYYLARALISLAVVLTMIYGAFYIARRLQLPLLPVRSAGPLRVEQSLALGSGHMLHVVRAGERVMLLSTGPGGTTVVAELRPEELTAGDAESCHGD